MPHNFEEADKAFRLAKSSEDGTVSPAGGMPKGVSPSAEVGPERVTWNTGRKSRGKR